MRSAALLVSLLALNACTPSAPALHAWRGSGMQLDVPIGWTVRPITSATNVIVEFDATSGSFGYGDMMRITCARMPFAPHAGFRSEGGSHVTDNTFTVGQGHFQLEVIHRCDLDSCGAESDVEARLRTLASQVMRSAREDGCGR